MSLIVIANVTLLGSSLPQTELAGGQSLLASLLCNAAHNLQEYSYEAWHDALQVLNFFTSHIGTRSRVGVFSHFNMLYNVPDAEC